MERLRRDSPGGWYLPPWLEWPPRRDGRTSEPEIQTAPAHALALAREGVPLNIIQRQLGHTNLGTTSIYL